MSLAATLLLLIGLVRLWPAGPADATPRLYSSRGDEAIQINEIQPTSHAQQRTPPPPAPLPPIVRPNDELIEEEPLDFTDSDLPIEEPDTDDQQQEGIADASAGSQPDTNARLLRYVEPDYTRAAREDNVRARVVVEVNVDAQGRVQSATILKRMLLDEDGTPTRVVSRLGYGLEEAALTAAQQCLFRPARADGQPVATRTTLTISFGS